MVLGSPVSQPKRPVMDSSAFSLAGRVTQLGSWEDLVARPGSRFVAEFAGAP